MLTFLIVLGLVVVLLCLDGGCLALMVAGLVYLVLVAMGVVG